MTGCSSRAPPARCQPAAACSPTSSPSSASASVPTPTGSTPRRSTRAGASSTEQIDEFFARLQTPRRGALERVLRRGPLPVSGLGARGAAAGGRFESRADVEALVAGFHRVARARVRRPRAGTVDRVHLLEGARDGAPPKPELARAAARRRRARPSRSGRRRACFGAAGALDTRCSAARRCSAGHSDRRARRSSRSRRRPSSSIPGSLATVTGRGDYLLERRRGMSAAAVTPSRQTAFDPVLLAVLANRFDEHRARDDEHAAAHRPLGRAQPWRATSPARSSPPTTSCSRPPRACRST